MHKEISNECLLSKIIFHRQHPVSSKLAITTTSLINFGKKGTSRQNVAWKKSWIELVQLLQGKDDFNQSEKIKVTKRCTQGVLKFWDGQITQREGILGKTICKILMI